MSGWKDEFDRRCRRVLGITDDSLPVDVEQESVWYSTMTGGDEYVEVRVGRKCRQFSQMSELIRALDEVPGEADR